MDRIKQALQRARIEKDQLPSSNAEKLDPRTIRVAPIRIDYNESQIIKLSDKTLLEKRIIAGHDDYEAAVNYKILRTQLIQRMQPRGWNTLAITSTGPSEGKTLTAMNLAVNIARQYASTVLLVDLDLRRPSISSFFGHESAQGLTDHLLKGVPLRDILFNPGIERLVILPAGSPIADASELLRSSDMFAFTKELKTRYKDRFILFDLPPLLVGDDALSFIPHVECVLLVIEDGRIHPDQLARAVELLPESKLIGTVLNKGRNAEKSQNYGYY